MTNAEIIFRTSLDLMKDGIIGTTGRMLKMETEKGTVEIPEPEVIHTFAAWKELGYIVKKGEHAVASFPVWKYLEKKVEGKTEEEAQKNGKCYMKKAFWFTAKQVERMKPRA